MKWYYYEVNGTEIPTMNIITDFQYITTFTMQIMQINWKTNAQND